MNKLGISEFNVNENTFSRGDIRYSVKSLIEASKDIKPFDLDIRGVDISAEPWGRVNIKDFAQHMLRINDADLSYPIILDDTGFICDGWHRLVKAIVKGDKTIKAKRLKIMPDCL